MWMKEKKRLQYACMLCAQSCVVLKKAAVAIFYAIGNDEDSDCLTETMENVNECKRKMVTVSNSLLKLCRISSRRSFIRLGKNSTLVGSEEEDSFSGDHCSFLRRAVCQCKLAYEALCNNYEVVLEALGSAANRDDNEQLYRNLKTIEECKEKLWAVSVLVAEISKRVEDSKIEALYAPPSYFEKRSRAYKTEQ